MKLSALVVIGLLACALFFPGCAAQQPQLRQGTVIAVWDFEDLSPAGSPFPDMGELMGARVIKIMQEEGRYTVVERQKLLLALEELNLGTMAIVDEATRLRLGRLAGAHFMVFGGYMVIERDMRLDMRLVSVETGAILKTASRIIPSEDLSVWLRNTEEAAVELL